MWPFVCVCGGDGVGYVRVSSTDASRLLVLLSHTAKPHITVQPKSQQVSCGQQFSLSIEVGPSPSSHHHHCSFQWFKDYTQLEGRTSAKLQVKSAMASDAGEYYCVAYNKGGSADSEIAFVKILNPHLLTTPHPQAAVPGAAATGRVGYWEGAASLVGHSLSVGGGSGGGSAAALGPYPGEEVGRWGYLEEGQPRSWGEGGGGGGGGGGRGPPVEGLIGRASSSGVGYGHLSSRRGSGPCRLTNIGQ